MKTFYYAETIKNVSLAFLNLFNDMVVKKYAKDGSVVKSINVPIRLGPVDKKHDSRREDYNNTNEPFYMTLPRMAVTGPNLGWAEERVKSANTIRNFYAENLGLDSVDEFTSDPHPTPYDFNYILHVKSHDFSYYCQILENVLPYFNPSKYMRVKEFSFLNIERDLEVMFNGDASLDLAPEFAENETDMYETQLGFTVKGWMYYPTFTSEVIKIINSKYYVDPTGGFTTDTSYKTEEYETSGYTISAEFPESYETSGYDSTSDVYYVTSADSFDV